MGHIQRAHNEGPFTPEWDEPSCPAGTFIRIFESLDHVHPDVNITAEAPAAVLAREVRNNHRVIFALKSQAERDAIVTGSETEDRLYQAYVLELRAAVMRAVPDCNAATLAEQTNIWMMQALFDE